ncbi:unnamed protein product [Cuscuta campestris]|uniref:TF-B3 domain-containing protein n=1 Tax=Cuscuta campestris TaxID=132261 RepID=A0A484NCT1_9ASTE|nr:unnamed protein product [Cuscuta campestris]
MILPHGCIKAVAGEFNISRKTVGKIWSLARGQMQDGLPVSVQCKRKGNFGRKEVPVDIPKMLAVPFHRRKNIRALGYAMEVSKSTVQRWLKRKAIRRHSNAMKPYLSYSGSSSFPYGRQQRVWLDEGGRGEEEAEEGAKAADPEAGGSGCGGAVAAAVEKEHMFDKVVTPSDVGKLNRLVIPKQHAEKYFPLDSSNNDKGLLLNFEDRNGKPWRFRYSYWNSSQSYVMTKGWSRFVKEKKLDAGDVVSFQRGASESARDRLFIDWRRRPDHHHHHLAPVISLPHHHFSSFQRSPFHQHYPAAAAAAAAWNHHQAVFSAPLHPSSYGYGVFSGGEVVVNGNPCSGVSSSGIYLRPIVAAAAAAQQQQMMHRGGVGGGAAAAASAVVFESMPVVVHGKAAAKRLRLFGVNVDCPILDGDTSSPSSSTSAAAASTTTTIPSTLLQLKSSGYDDDGNNDTEELHLESDDYNNNKPRKSSSSASIDGCQTFAAAAECEEAIGTVVVALSLLFSPAAFLFPCWPANEKSAGMHIMDFNTNV